MKAVKYREMNADEIENQIAQIRLDLYNMRVGNTTKELQNPSKIKIARRDLARAMTVLGEKKAQ
jgi:large subunit ribosomal protein L29